MNKTYEHPWYKQVSLQESITDLESELTQKLSQEELGQKFIDSLEETFQTVCDIYPYIADHPIRDKCDRFVRAYASITGQRYD